MGLGPDGPPGAAAQTGGTPSAISDWPSFAAEVKPIFREQDRASMRWAFDLWSRVDVARHAEAILVRLASGTMPCDGAWPPERVGVFRRWIETGMRE